MGWIVINYGLHHKIIVMVATMSCMTLLFIPGCSQPENNSGVARQARAIPYAIVTSGDPGAGISSVSTYNWAPGMPARNESLVLNGIPVNRYIEAAIGKTLAAKGYRFDGTENTHGLSVGYEVALGNSLNHDQTGSRYGMQPGLATAPVDAQHYEQGTLVVILLDSRTGQQAWRSALQGFADLDIPANVRQQRINDIIGRMLEGFPDRRVRYE